MSERHLTRKLTALCLLVAAVVTIGLALSGVLQQLGGTRAPVAHIIAR